MYSNRLSGFLHQSAIRQALSLLVVFAVLSTAIWGGTYWLVTREINRLIDARLDAQITEAINTLKHNEPLPVPGFGQSIALIRNGQIHQGSLPAPFKLIRRRDGYYQFDTKKHPNADYRYLIRTVENDRVIVAENVERQDELFDVLQVGLQAALLTSLAASLLTGLLIARRNQARLDSISNGLAEVARGNLALRINLPDRRDDLSLLANRIDTTVQRLEQTLEQVRVQSSNIAHDLRTPLARLRALIEKRYLALLEKSEPVSADVLESALLQIDRIVGTFDALLRIARIESGARKASFTRVDLKDIARSVEEYYGPVVEDAGQNLSVSIDDPAPISGDRDLLIQLIANLLQNALRYGPIDQTIALKVHGRQLSVSDQGPGIPFAEREKVLEPLYQMEQARHSDGFGLGLSLVRAICELHSASLTLSDGPDQCGLSVTVRFPHL